MVTGDPDATLARSTWAHGAFDYIVKPFKMERSAPSGELRGHEGLIRTIKAKKP
jgi:hypothetical protein